MIFDVATINTVHQQTGFDPLYIEKVLRLLGILKAVFAHSVLMEPQGFTSLSRQAQLHIFTRRQPLFTFPASLACSSRHSLRRRRMKALRFAVLVPRGSAA